MTSKKEWRTGPLRQDKRPAAESTMKNARSYTAVSALPTLQAATDMNSAWTPQPTPAVPPFNHTAVVQRRVGMEVETGIPVYTPYNGNTHGLNANLLGMCFNGSDYSRSIRGNQNGVELHADKGAQIYAEASKYHKENILGRQPGLPQHTGIPGILEFVTSKAGLVDELGNNGKQNLITHLTEINNQITQMEQTGPHAAGAHMAGISYAWGDQFKNAMKNNGYSPQINIGIDLGGLAGLFSDPMGRTLTNGHFWGIGEAQSTSTDIALLMNKIRTLPIGKEEDEETDKLPTPRLLGSMEGVLNILVMYFKGAGAGHNPSETQKNAVPYLLKGTFKTLWDELLKQFPDQNGTTPYAGNEKEWFIKIKELISAELDNKYLLQAVPAGRMGGHPTLSSAFETLMNGGNISTSISSGDQLNNDVDSSINAEIPGQFPELNVESVPATPVVEIRHMNTYGSLNGLKDDVVGIVKEVIDHQLKQFGPNAGTIKTNAGW